MKIKNYLDYSITSFVIIDENFGSEIEIQPGEEKEVPLPEGYLFPNKNFQEKIDKAKILCWGAKNEPSKKEALGYEKKLILSYTEIAQEFPVKGFDSFIISIRNSKYRYLQPFLYNWNYEDDFDE